VTGWRPDLVLLPGMLGDVTAWDDVAALLCADASIRTCRLEFDDDVRDLAAGVLAEAPPFFAMAGHSFGAIVGLEMQRQAPSRVLSVAVVNGSARGPNDAQLAAWAAWHERTEHGEFAAVVEELALATLPEERRGDAALVRRSAAMGHAIGPEAFVRQLTAQQMRPDSLASLPGIGVPTLVVSSELDQVCPPALQQEIVDHVPGARLVTLAATGHMSPLENPAGVATALRTWLRFLAFMGGPRHGHDGVDDSPA
jgi:pimeloyl-ACP methyl ester carboxylesterase